MRPGEGGAWKCVFLSVDLEPGLFLSYFVSGLPILFIFRPAGPNSAQEGPDLQVDRGWAVISTAIPSPWAQLSLFLLPVVFWPEPPCPGFHILWLTPVPPRRSDTFCVSEDLL